MWMFHGIGLKSSNESFFGNTVLISNRCDYVFYLYSCTCCLVDNSGIYLITSVLSGSNVVEQILVPTHPDPGGFIHSEMPIKGK